MNRPGKVKKNIFLFILLIVVLFSSLLRAQYHNDRVIISIKKNVMTENKLREMGLDFLMEWNKRVYIITSPDHLLELRKGFIPYRLETYALYPFNRKETFSQGGMNGDYHSYQELEQELIILEESYPHLARVFDIGDSLENRNIYALKISDNVHLNEEEAGVIFLGCHHAREWISVEIPFLLGKYLVENYDSNSEVKNLVDQSEIWLIPLVNPDGLEYSIHFYRYWRKNRRYNSDGTYGVDLNRNYGYMWGLDDIGSSPNPSASDYRGTSPFSEPETQAVRNLFAEKFFQALITYHSYSQIICYPWGYTNTPSEQDTLLNQMAEKMSKLIQSVSGSVYEYFQGGKELYLANGDTADWSFGTYSIPSFTIELPPIDHSHGGFFNAEEDIQSIFRENLPAMLYLIDWSIQNFKIDNWVPKKRKYKPRKKFPK